MNDDLERVPARCDDDIDVRFAVGRSRDGLALNADPLSTFRPRTTESQPSPCADQPWAADSAPGQIKGQGGVGIQSLVSASYNRDDKLPKRHPFPSELEGDTHGALVSPIPPLKIGILYVLAPEWAGCRVSMRGTRLQVRLDSSSG